MFLIQQSTDDGETWTNIPGQRYEKKFQADGAYGPFNARKKAGVQYRIKEVKPKPHISFILGAVGAKMWLNGCGRTGYGIGKDDSDLEYIDRFLRHQYIKYDRSRKIKPVRNPNATK